jgi:hypothetical protein
MIVGGGGGTTAAEVDDLEITSCGIGDFVFLIPLYQLAFGNHLPERGGKKGELEWYWRTRFPRFSGYLSLLPHRRHPSRQGRASALLSP